MGISLFPHVGLTDGQANNNNNNNASPGSLRGASQVPVTWAN